MILDLLGCTTIINTRKLKKDIKICSPFPNEIFSFGCTLVSFIVDVRKHHSCVPKENEFRCLTNGHCACCNLDWGITIYHHFKKKSAMILDLLGCTTINNFNLF
jgi:hypothetical protein